MMNIKKVIILLIGLVLPVGIFLFLKFFGENKFEVQPLFQTELPVQTQDCGDLPVPYGIPAEFLTEFNTAKNSLNVVLVDASLSVLSRIFDQFSGDPVSIKRIESADSRNGKLLKDCVFLISPPNDMVLFDQQGIIRGQYNSGDRDEIDRLILELSILLNK